MEVRLQRVRRGCDRRRVVHPERSQELSRTERSREAAKGPFRLFVCSELLCQSTDGSFNNNNNIGRLALRFGRHEFLHCL